MVLLAHEYLLRYTFLWIQIMHIKNNYVRLHIYYFAYCIIYIYYYYIIYI